MRNWLPRSHGHRRDMPQILPDEVHVSQMFPTPIMIIQTYSATPTADRRPPPGTRWSLDPVPSVREHSACLPSGSAFDVLVLRRRRTRETLTGAPSTVARQLSAVSSFYSYSVDEGGFG